jgi:hypothetical protein
LISFHVKSVGSLLSHRIDAANPSSAPPILHLILTYS